MKEFDAIGLSAITVQFHCPQCEALIQSEQIELPSPNFMAERSDGSYNYADSYPVCGECGSVFAIEVAVGFYDAYVEIMDVEEEDIEIEGVPDYDEELLDSILSNTQFFDNFINSIQVLEQLSQLKIGEQHLVSYNYKLIYASVITCIETYLSDAFINTVLQDKHFKRFVETYKDFSKQKFQLSELYEKVNKIKDIGKKVLLDVIYHDLAKVNGMYRDALSVTFPDFGELQKAILIRHDLVHRNGKTKDGTLVEIGQKEIQHLIAISREFVDKIDSQVKAL